MDKSKLQHVFEKIDKLIDRYYNYNNLSAKELIEIARELAAYIYYLGTIKSKFNKDYDGIIYREVNVNRVSGIKAESIAKELIPQLRDIREVYNASKGVLEVIRTEISYIKTEMSNRDLEV